MKNVIELLRVSTESQASEDKAGLAAQRAANQRTAAQFDLQITDTIELIDVSGTSVLYAPGYQRLLEMIAAPNVDGVVAKEFSRLFDQSHGKMASSCSDLWTQAHSSIFWTARSTRAPGRAAS